MSVSQEFSLFEFKNAKNEMIFPLQDYPDDLEVNPEVIEGLFKYFWGNNEIAKEKYGEIKNIPEYDEKYKKLYISILPIFEAFMNAPNEYIQVSMKFNYSNQGLGIIYDKNNKKIPVQVPVKAAFITLTYANGFTDALNAALQQQGLNNKQRYIMVTISF